MVEISGIEPLTSCVQGRRSPSWAISPCHRLFITLFTFITHSVWVVGLSGLEPPTSPLSGVRSNHLSYRPKGITVFCSILSTIYQSICVDTYCLSFFGKEVIQPQVPLRLPCYDFTPVMNHTVVNALPKVKLSTSGTTHSHGVTGGVYKARERIHRNILICDY